MQVDLYNGHKMVVVAVPEKPLGISDRFLTGWMFFLTLNQQCLSTEDDSKQTKISGLILSIFHPLLDSEKTYFMPSLQYQYYTH